MADKKKTIFISYSWKDRAKVVRIKDALPADFDIWFDQDSVAPGQDIAKQIEQGLTGADYYLLVISEASAASVWVRREVVRAFELATQKKLSVVPILIDNAEVPFEFRGLLYIDARSSFETGVNRISEFFYKQLAKLSDLEPREVVRKSFDDEVTRRAACTQRLRDMEFGDLRYLLSQRLSIEEVAVVWFDMFHRRMHDEMQVTNLSLSLVELLDRSRREDALARLLDTLCRNYGRLAPR